MTELFLPALRACASRLSAAGLALACALTAAAPARAQQAFDFYDLSQRAKSMAGESYKAPASTLPKELRDLKFAEYQQIQMRREKYYWAGSKTPFQLVFNHQGMYFDLPVKVNVVDAEGVHPVKYDPADFDFGGRKLDPKLLQDLGFAGFRLLYALNDGGKRDDELASFLGASYFRMVGKGQVYGASARGLAIDTAVPSGEEFPRFVEYWIQRPSSADKHIVVFALLDSRRVTGAYRFTITPGEDTTVQVRSRIFLREPVAKLGLAPMTSMFLYGTNQPPTGPVNFRPELHDSDGLSFHAGNGEWLWRPLNNPKRLATSSFSIENPRGFGLMQRGREFERYEDIDDRYELRPSLWIEPEGDWGKGRVELVEIPTADETNDNIVAMWVPETPPKPGEAFDVNYAMRWTRGDAKLIGPGLARIEQTRRYAGETKGADMIRRPDGSTAFLIDFSAPADAAAPARKKAASKQPDPVSLSFSTNGNADVLENSLRRNPATGGWRVTLRIKVKDPTRAVEMRAALVSGQTPLSETWSYQVPANETAE
ncbi:glucan biosynthesis protein G [Pigmentiphaga soli]|uniref:Glucans biosynthesis protein G n=1 Tax=Pigmentiphaga soli TaxID=1007095 RepID=A0ABP8GT52_9BURK